MNIFADIAHINLVHHVINAVWPFLEVNGSIVDGLKYLGAGVSTIACMGSGIGQGFAGGKAVEAVSRNPEVEAKIRTQFVIGAAIAESGAIYGLVVSLILIFVAS